VEARATTSPALSGFDAQAASQQVMPMTKPDRMAMLRGKANCPMVVPPGIGEPGAVAARQILGGTRWMRNRV
jgi:hypothetical protein